MTDTAIAWHKVAKTSEVEEEEPKSVEIGDRLIGLYRLGDEYFALDDVCTHEFAMLSDGYVEDGCIECPLHQAQFDIRTGKVTAPPADVDLRTYPVRIEGDDILVGVSED